MSGVQQKSLLLADFDNGLINDGAFKVEDRVVRLVGFSLDVDAVYRVEACSDVNATPQEYGPVIKGGVPWDLTLANNIIEIAVPGNYRLEEISGAVTGDFHVKAFYATGKASEKISVFHAA